MSIHSKTNFADLKNVTISCTNCKIYCCCSRSNNAQNSDLSDQNIEEEIRNIPLSPKKVEPGKGLLAYSERLSSFCKPTRPRAKKLLEVPKDAECFPKQKLKHHKLCFLDDAPYSTTVNNYIPDYTSDIFLKNSSGFPEKGDEEESCCRCCRKCWCRQERLKTNVAHDCDRNLISPYSSLRNHKPYGKDWDEVNPRPDMELRALTKSQTPTWLKEYTYYRCALPGWVTNHPVKREWYDMTN